MPVPAAGAWREPPSSDEVSADSEPGGQVLAPAVLAAPGSSRCSRVQGPGASEHGGHREPLCLLSTLQPPALGFAARERGSVRLGALLWKVPARAPAAEAGRLREPARSWPHVELPPLQHRLAWGRTRGWAGPRMPHRHTQAFLCGGSSPRQLRLSVQYFPPRGATGDGGLSDCRETPGSQVHRAAPVLGLRPPC